MSVFNLTLDQLRQRTSVKWRLFPEDVLPMFVAEMDCALPDAVVNRLREIITLGDTGYPYPQHYWAAFADFAGWRWGWEPDPNRFGCVGDVMQGLRAALEALTRPGDLVVFNPPVYPPFRRIIEGTQRRGLPVALVENRLDLVELERAFASGAKAYLLCSPHNPTGTVHTGEELRAVAELGRKYGVAVLVDEIHAPFNGMGFTPFLALSDPGVALVATSAGKAFNLAGFKAGLLIASVNAQQVLEGLPRYVAEAMSHVGAQVQSAALLHSRDWLLKVADEVSRNKRLFAEQLAARLPKLRYEPAEGTYLAWVDCSALDLTDPGEFFFAAAKVRFSFGAEFAPEASQWIRVNLATSPKTILEAVRRMEGAFDRRSSYCSA